MSRDELREQLAHIAGTAPVASVPPDTYRRGRRAAARRRIAAGVVAAGCLALASVIGAQLAGRAPRAADPAGASAAGGVPDHIWAPPYALPATSDFKVGLAAAAYVDTRHQVIVVGADGGYRRLGLPGSDAAGAEPVTALAPDGRYLGAVRTLPDPGGTYRSDIVVIDLTTGATRYVLPRGPRQNITALAWSANSGYLSWQGAEVGAWTATTYHPTGADDVGTLRVSDGRRRQWPTLGAGADTITVRQRSYTTDRPRPLAVSDSGQVALVAGNTLWLDGRRSRVALRASDAGSDVVSAIWFGRRGLVGTLYFGRGSDAQIGSLTDGTARSSLGIQVPLFRGLLPNETVLLQHDDSPGYARTTEISAVRYHPGVALGGTPIVRVDPHVASLSLATDLLGPHGETVHRPSPHWPWSTQRRVTVYVGLPLLACALAGVGWWWRRRRLTHQ